MTKLRILVAEDNPVVRELTMEQLALQGHEPFSVISGKDALSAMLLDDFDMILMALEMPEMDAVRATEAIRQMEAPTGERIPILATTSKSPAEVGGQWQTAGMDGYISKPVIARELNDAIGRLMSRHKNGVSIAAGRHPSSL